MAFWLADGPTDWYKIFKRTACLKLKDSRTAVSMLGFGGEGMETPNGFQQEINYSQEPLVSIKSSSLIKVSAAGNLYK